MHPSVELVVARFHEDLRWLKRVPPSIRVTVYEKGGAGFASPSGTAIPNIGREAHTYLHHITTRYNDLAPTTVFCQGKPFDHVSDFHKVLRSLQVDQFKWLGHIIDRDDRTGSLLFQKWSKNENHRPLPLGDFWNALWNEPAPPFVTFYPGANFAVTAEQIRTQPIEFYARALKIAAEMPDAAHCFERTWDRVFGVNGIPVEFCDQPLPIYLKPIRRLAQIE